MAKLDRSLNQVPGLSRKDAGYVNTLQIQENPRCPICVSDQVQTLEAIDTLGAMGSRQMRCHTCNALWLEVWQCVGYLFDKDNQ